MNTRSEAQEDVVAAELTESAEAPTTMNDLKSRWTTFFSLMGDPWTLLFIGATAVLLYFSTQQTQPRAEALFVLVTTISGGVVGARLSKQWQEVAEEGALRARGKTAVRGLRLLLTGILGLDRMAEQLLRPVDGPPPEMNILKYAIGQVRARCGILADETTSAIENWTDIVPEADIKSQVGRITELQFAVEEAQNAQKHLAEEVAAARNKSASDLEAAEKRLRDKEREAAELRAELRKKEAALNSPFSLSASYPSTPGFSAISDYLSSIKGEGGTRPVDLFRDASKKDDSEKK